MSTTALSLNALESGLLRNHTQTSLMRKAFDVAESAFPGAFCSDCCGSNGNDCSPGGEPWPEMPPQV